MYRGFTGTEPDEYQTAGLTEAVIYKDYTREAVEVKAAVRSPSDTAKLRQLLCLCLRQGKSPTIVAQKQ